MNQMCYLNRKRLLDYLLIHGGPVGMNIAVVLQGGKSSNFYDTDVENLFRQESFFQWCFDVDIPDCYAAILFDRGSKFRSVLFVPKMPPDFEIWVGRMPTFDQLKDKYSVDERAARISKTAKQQTKDSLRTIEIILGSIAPVHYIDNIVEYLVSYNVGKVHTLKGTNSDSNLNHFGVDLDLSRFQVDTEHLHEMMSDLRVYKTEYEVEMIKKATEVTLEAHKAVMLYCKPDMYEYELEAKFLQSIYKTNGCRFVSYTCICASGVNNQILHYGHAAAPNNKQIKKGDLCLFDMGANYKGYASDITCTFPVNGTFSVEQRIIYNIVLNINRTIIATLRPGVSWVSMHVKSLRLLIEALQSIGVLNSGNVKQMIADGVGATFQPHGIGHLIGLDVHDVGAYLNKTPPRPDHIPGVKKLRTSRILEFRMCLTVEPGCYFNECLLERARNSATLNPYFNWEQIEKFKYVGGVRIEDIVLITEKGCELLSADVPREVEEIESFLRLRPYLD